MKIILIGGASASGKTALAARLENKLLDLGHRALKISMDDYFKEIPSDYHLQVDVEDHHEIPEGYPYPEDPNATVINHFRHHTNFYQTSMYDYDLLAHDLAKLNLGSSIEKPIFDFSTNLRLRHETVNTPEYLIIEGLFAVHFAQTRCESFDNLKVFVSNSSYIETKKRRIERDGRERGLTSQHVISHEIHFGGPAFFGDAPLRHYASAVIPPAENCIAKSKLYADIEVNNDATFSYQGEGSKMPEDYNPHHDISYVHPLDAGIKDIIEALALEVSRTEAASMEY